MNLEKLQEEFNVRYYLWALEDFEREIDQGFPFLQLFRNESPWCVVTMMSEMDEAERMCFAKSLVKRFHEDAVKTIGETITADERQLCERYFNKALQLDTQRIVTRFKHGASKAGPLASRARIRRLVRNVFSKANIHLAEEEDLDGVITYSNKVGYWEIITRIYTRDRDSQVSYDHAIWSVERVNPVTKWDGKNALWPIRLGHSISFLSWLGISGPTEWCNLANDDCSLIADAVAKLYFHFLEVAPKLLNGLSVS